jgi:hypothetical protein
MNSLIGRYVFQARFISLSYRYRGNVVRTHTQIKTIDVEIIYNTRVLDLWPKRKKLITRLRRRMLAYSAIKIKANPTLPYSMLNPETSSDSPSAKSKGVRLVSAKEEIKNIITIGMKIISFLQKEFRCEICRRFISMHKLKKKRRIRANLTS